MGYNKVRELTIVEAEAGQRLDNLLMKEFKGVPKSRIYSMLRKGEVRINKGRVKPGYRVQCGDRVRLPPVHTRDPQQTAVVPDIIRIKLEQSVLYEDQDLLVINKPSGLAVHGGSGLHYGVIEALRSIRPESKYLELVHRLDRDTSGCLLLAKSRQRLTELHEALREGKIHKTYLALLYGRWQGAERDIETRLEKQPGALLKGGKMQVAETGKVARSTFSLMENFESACLVQVKLHTGRTHQIRVHAAEIGHPILGDKKYGDFASNRIARQQGLKRLFLHAAEIRYHPEDSGKAFHFTAPLPDELENVLQHYRR